MKRPYWEVRHAQGSPEWHRARCGYLTASKAGVLLDGTVEARNNLMEKLLAEEMAGEAVEKNVFSLAMQWGTRHEERARAMYNLSFPEMDSCGFFVHGTLPFIGGSPDGVLRSGELVAGGLEIKCPFNQEIHEGHRNGKIPPAYYWQIQFGMWLLNVPFWDFMSFDPRREEAAQCYFRRFERERAVMRRIDDAVDDWCTHRKYGSRYQKPVTPVELMAAGMLPKFF